MRTFARPLSLGALAAPLLLLPVSLHAQGAAPAAAPRRAQVMIVGTYHMANPGRDMANVTADDVLAPARQEQIARLVKQLAEFRPTRIALEIPTARDSATNARYAAMRRGTGTLSRSESEQVGFRLAAALGHEQVYGIDVPMELDMGSVFQFAMANGQQQTVGELQREVQSVVARVNEQMTRLTVSELLVEHNLPVMDSLMQAAYLKLLRVGRDTNYVGARMAGQWWQRNFRIHSNLTRLVTSPENRVLVLIGAGHASLLKDFVRGAGEWELVDPVKYLRR